MVSPPTLRRRHIPRQSSEEDLKHYSTDGMYCQKCRVPLKADISLDPLNPAAFDLLVGSTDRSHRKATNHAESQFPPDRRILYERSARDVTSPLINRNVPPIPNGDVASSKKQESDPGMSFIEITQSQIVATDKQEQKPTDPVERRSESNAVQVSRHERLFSFLSSHSDIDHPICAECSMMLVSAFNTRLTSATRERDAYASFLRSLQQTPSRTESSSIQQTLDALLQEEGNAFDELTKLEQEKAELDSLMVDLEEEAHRLDLEEQHFWKLRNAFDDQLHDLEVDLTSLQQRYSHDQQQLERLQRTNVYNDTFCIGHDNYFGTINGLRLGRLPSQNVEWAEINAAWGHTVLLLATVAERLSFTFRGYRLRPLGSTSRIEKLEWPQRLPDGRQGALINPPPKTTYLDLFSSGDMPLGRVFNHRRFDAGMVAFLDCLSQLGASIDQFSKLAMTQNPSGQGRSPTIVLPYPIDGDRIGGVSIRLGVGFSQDENFTKACKYALTCCKFLLAHVSNLESAK